jgi:PKD repeat protein
MVDQRLRQFGVTPAQVEVAWVKEADAQPVRFGDFPNHAQHLQSELAAIARNLVIRYPSIKIAYYSSRTHAYTNDRNGLNPEPFAYESGFSTKWLIEDQLNGNPDLNYDPNQGRVVAPYLSWGPYLWADDSSRSDGFTWNLEDVQSDFTHPSPSGVQKVADQLLAFFKTDPTATPWFLRSAVIGEPPVVIASADPASGSAPLTVNFSADAYDPDGTIMDLVWTFDDGTFSDDQNPTKIFPAPGNYNAHVTVTDNDGNAVTQTVSVTVSSTAPGGSGGFERAVAAAMGRSNSGMIDLSDATSRVALSAVLVTTDSSWLLMETVLPDPAQPAPRRANPGTERPVLRHPLALLAEANDLTVGEWADLLVLR